MKVLITGGTGTVGRALIKQNNNEYISISRNEEKIADRIKNNQDLFDRDIKYEKVEIDGSFPKYIFNNKEMFKEWII